ncbi:MAG TPA: hypothetical protein VFI27_09150 [candidate division Zixibacteria bacterium]|nr:hypothetical protein [candidate division Zixibacteria bacterium]
MARTLDRSKKFGMIFGVDEHGAVFWQDNHKFDNAGAEVGEGISPVIADPIRPGAAGPAAVAPIAATPTVPEAPKDTKAALEELHPSQLKKLVEDAGLVAFGGAGSKAANIKLLLDNE